MKFSNILILLLIVCDAFLIGKVLQISKQKKELNFLMASRTEALSKSKEKFVKLQTNVLASHHIESTKLSDSFNSLLSMNEPTLVLRVHENNCNDCVKESLLIMKRIKQEASVQCVVFAKYPSVSSFKVSYPNEFITYIVPDMIQDSAAKTKPFIFLIDKDKKIKHVFFPEWDMVNLLESYQDLVIRLLK